MNKTAIRLIGAAIIAVLAYEARSLDVLPRSVICIVVGVSAFILLIMSRRQLGTAFAIMPAAKALVTTGLYSKIQHPMYVFLDCFLVAVITLLDAPVFLCLWGILVIVQTLQSRREESLLRASFGVEYDTYAKGTWF
jgi:protein-S-isoprenylcysteine O-methyltransferase Ste14